MLVGGILAGGMLVGGILEEIYITRGMTPSSSRQFLWRPRIIGLGLQQLRKGAEPLGEGGNAQIFFALAKILSSIVSGKQIIF